MRVEDHFGTSIISLQGEFDLTCQERFEDELEGALDNETESLVVDLRGLEFIDSIGLQMLVQMNKLAEQDRVAFVVLADEGQVRLVLHESGLDGLLPVVDRFGAVPASDSPV